MSSPWLSIDNNFPTFSGSEGVREQVRLIHDFLPIMIECLKYQLSNLGVNNWNKTEKETFQKETTKEVEQAIDTTDKELAQVIKELEDVSTRMTAIVQRFDGVETDLAYLEDWKETITPQIEQVDAAIADLSADLDAIEQTLKEDDDGITLGREGVRLNLVGTVYINGIRYES